eukprot:CAMPEP_0197197290 /NCGR_PEP_ID=MMETSP1423-20130617/32789_1 /TAXON_ID=476441 /ORGANISM="Pseudo-nitzschia heimii, Strain UNC1101" /LENGTH=271 /DNA_ID=CAMNT_0042651109 /DNA_START=16 /DNA_END=831 /DNA_ORIENTATION=+
MAISLRRSRRSTKKGVSDYNVGDIVEIDRQHGVVARGRLAQLLTEGPSPNPRWLVKFDSQPYKDEEMYERAFGKLIHSNEESEEHQSAVVASEVASSASARTKTDIATEPLNDSKGSRAVGEGDNFDDAKKGKNINDNNVETTTLTTGNLKSKSVQFQKNGATLSQDSADDSSPTEENSRGGTNHSRASAREARSRRRQAMIDDAAIVPGTEILAGKRKLPPPPPGHRSKQYKNNETQYAEDGEVVKVKLLTGTLYLYRGAQRRVEFIRRV